MSFEEHEQRLLWLIDLLVQQPLPFNWQAIVSERKELQGTTYYFDQANGKPQWEHPNDGYFQQVLQLIRQSAGSLQSNSLEWLFTTRPPQTVINIISTLSYFQVLPGQHLTWIAMLAQSCDINHEFIDEQVKNLPLDQYGMNTLGLKVFRDKITGEISDVNPDDSVFKQFIEWNLVTEGNSIIPQLTREEAQQLPRDQVLVYNFNLMRSFVMPKHELVKVRRIKVPDFQDKFPSNDAFLDFFNQHKNILEGMEGVNRIVFTGKTVPFAPPKPEVRAQPPDDPYNQMRKTMNQSPNLKSLPKYVVSKSQYEQICAQNNSQHGLQTSYLIDDIPLASSLNEYGESMKQFEQLSQIEDPANQKLIKEAFMSSTANRVDVPNPRHLQTRYLDRKVLSLFSENDKNSDLVQFYLNNNDNQIDRIVLLQKGFANSVPKPFFEQKLSRLQPLPDDYIMQQILDPPPRISRFYAVLKLDKSRVEHIMAEIQGQFSKMERSTSHYAVNGVMNYSRNPVDELLFAYYRKQTHEQKLLFLNLMIEVSYLDQDEVQAKYLMMNTSSANNSAVSTHHQGREDVQQKALKPLPILTESTIKFLVNQKEVPNESINLSLNYKLTISDFHIGMPVQTGRYTFVTERMDAMTKFYINSSLEKLSRMRTKLEQELLKCGHGAFVASKLRQSQEQVDMCQISLRKLGGIVFALFEKLQKIKPELKLQSFE